MRRFVLLPLLFSVVVGGGGCFRRPLVPPTIPLLAESPRILRDDAPAMRGVLSLQLRDSGPAIVGGQLGYARAVRERVEVSVTGATLVLAGETDLATTPHRAAYTGRVGVKYGAHNFAVAAGLGGGLAPAYGGFVGFDAGILLGWENPYVVPFFSARAGVGIPTNPRGVDVSTVDEGAGTVVIPPATTVLAGLVGGLRIPIGPDRGEGFDRPADLTLAVGVTGLYDNRGSTLPDTGPLVLGTYSVALGFSARFGTTDDDARVQEP